MRVLGLHGPTNRPIQQYSGPINCGDANGRSRRRVSSVSSALPTTTPYQAVVDAETECSADEWLSKVDTPLVDVQTRQLRSGTSPQHVTVLTGTAASSNAGQQCNTRTQCRHSVASVTSADNQQGQLSGLHVLRQYVPSAADLLQEQLQQAPSQAGTSPDLQLLVSDDGKELQKSIVRMLRSCCSAQQLAEVIDQHGPEMDFISITSCFSAAVQLLTQQRKPLQGSEDSYASQHPLQGGFQYPNQRMGLHHEHQCTQDSAAAASQLLNPHSCALLNDLARDGPKQQISSTQRPNNHPAALEQPVQSSNWSRDQLHDLLQQQLVPLLQSKLQRSADATGLVLVLYSLAVLGYTSDEKLLADLEQAVTPVVSQLSARLSSQLLWSLSTLGIQPQQLLMMRLLLQSSRLMWQANAQDCAQLIQGLAKLQQRPPDSWIERYYSRVFELLQDEQLTPQALSIIMYSLGKLQLVPPATLLLDLQAESQHALLQLPPTGIVMLGNALHMLGVKQPGISWQYSYLQAVQNVLQDCTARELAVLAVPLMRWRRVPPQQWLQQYLDVCEQHLSHMTAQGLAVLGHSLSALKVLPSGQWLLQYLTAAQHQQLASTSAGCSYLMCTLGAWKPLQPEAAAAAVRVTHVKGNKSRSSSSSALMDVLASQCVECFLIHGERFSAEQLGVFCKGLAMFGLQGQEQLCKRLRQVALPLLQPGQQKMRQRHSQQQRQQYHKPATAATVVNILLALAVSCQAAATPKLVRALWVALQQQMHTVEPAQASAVAWASAKLVHQRTAEDSKASFAAYQPPGVLADGLLRQVLVEVQLAAFRDLTVLLSGVRKAGWAVGPARVQVLVDELLKKQMVLLQEQQFAATRVGQTMAESPAEAKQLQEQQQVPEPAESAKSAHVCLAGAEPVVDASQQEGLRQQQHHQYCSAGGHNNSSNSSRRHDSSTNWRTGSLNNRSNSSSSGSSQAARVYGLANHRLKGHLAATAAVAAWAHVVDPETRSAALQLCMRYLVQSETSSWYGQASSKGDNHPSCTAGQQQQKLLGALAIDVCSLLTGHATASCDEYQVHRDMQQHLQQVQLPQQLAELLWKRRDAFWDQLSISQQQSLLTCWRAAGVVKV